MATSPLSLVVAAVMTTTSCERIISAAIAYSAILRRIRVPAGVASIGSADVGEDRPAKSVPASLLREGMVARATATGLLDFLCEFTSHLYLRVENLLRASMFHHRSERIRG